MQKSFFVTLLILLVNFCFAQTQSELNEQEHTKYVEVDNELNSTYQKVLKEYKSDPIFIKNLKASLWIQFQDAEMKMKYPERKPGYYGRVQPMCWSIYITQLTRERVDVLKQWLYGIEEGDVCPRSVKTKCN